MKIRINVGKRHIDTAEYGDPNSCMVAKAIDEQLDVGDEIRASIALGRDNWLFGPKGSLPIKLPQWVHRRIRRWDSYEDNNEYGEDYVVRGKARTKPFEFEFELPDNWREQLTGKP